MNPNLNFKNTLQRINNEMILKIEIPMSAELNINVTEYKEEIIKSLSIVCIEEYYLNGKAYLTKSRARSIADKTGDALLPILNVMGWRGE